jgi:hypothetical protein
MSLLVDKIHYRIMQIFYTVVIVVLLLSNLILHHSYSELKSQFDSFLTAQEKNSQELTTKLHEASSALHRYKSVVGYCCSCSVVNKEETTEVCEYQNCNMH